MHNPLRRACLGLILAAFAVAPAHAQLTLSYLDGTTTPASVSGQSFTPGDAGTFPTASAYLTSMQFEAGGNTSGAVYLDLYSSLSSGVYGGYLGSSTNSQVWTTGSLLTWNFDSIALDKDTTYYAIFSSDAADGAPITRPVKTSSANPYTGGTMIYSNTSILSYDANFTATFATTAVPEPSTYAALAGLVALGFVMVRRRRIRA